MIQSPYAWRGPPNANIVALWNWPTCYRLNEERQQISSCQAFGLWQGIGAAAGGQRVGQQAG
ncbi:hypothetical protein, partial [Ruegeria arenilitoris]|uniref:hypothetical protein n=1 Tax=Ruegeria arenilitoris TaxID=1173585 RepID=UPI001C2C1084